MEDTLVTLIGICATITGIILAFLTFRRGEKNASVDEWKSEGALLSDIQYIKASIDRMEGKLDKVENNYQDLLTRVIRLEHRLMINDGTS